MLDLESSLSGGKLDLLEEIGERGVESIERALGAWRTDWLRRAGGAQGSGVEPHVEHGDLCARRRDAIPVAARHALDEAVEPEAPQVVGHGARAIRGRIAALQLRDVIAEFPMPKARGCQGEETERVHERVDPRVAEAEAGRALIVDEDGGRDGVEAVFADRAVVAQRFDV